MRLFNVAKKIARGLIKTIGILLLTIVLFAVSLVVGFFIVPEMEITEPRLKALVARFAPKELEIKWEDASLKIVRSGLLGKDILLDLDHVCIRYKENAVDACFTRLFWGGGFSVSNFNPRISKFLPLIATGGEVRGNLDLLKSGEPQKEEAGGFDVFEFARETLLPRWQWNGSIVELKTIDLKTGSRRAQGAFLLETQGSWDQSPLSQRADELKIAVAKRNVTEQFLRVSLIQLNIPGIARSNAQMQVVLPKETDERIWKVLLRGDTELPDGKRILISSENEIYNWRSANFAVNAILEKVSFVRQAQLRGEYRGDSLSGLFSAKVGGVHSQVRTLDFVDCGFKIALQSKEAEVRCGPQTVTLGVVERPTFDNFALFRLFPTFDLKLSNFSYDRGIETDWDLKLALDHVNILDLDLSAFGRFESISETDTTEEELHYSADADVVLRVGEFQKLVRLLRKTPFAIPAPINSMGGSLELSANGNIDETGGDVPFRFVTGLKSAHQKLATTLNGQFSLNPNAKNKLQPELRFDLALDDVRLSIPRIDVTANFPQLTPDSRFQKGLAADRPPTETEASTPLKLDARIVTSKAYALKLNSNLTGAPIPITLRYLIRPMPEDETVPLSPARAPAADVGEEPPTSQSSGRIYVGQTPIDFKNTNVKFLKRLERDAVIDFIDLRIEPDGTQRISGRLLVKNPDAEIRIIFLGTVEQPVVRLESDPPADESKIMAALLFGRPLDQIDQDQAQSAAQAKTALNDTALTLVQMFLLTNSPIDSLSYDAESGRVVASVGIGGGTTLELGGGAGEAGTEVGLRRRIARNVYLNTYVEDSPQSDSRLVSAFVEWVRRF